MEKEFLGHLSGLKSIAVNSKDGILATGAKVYLFI
jgi:WD40 repeat protein